MTPFAIILHVITKSNIQKKAKFLSNASTISSTPSAVPGSNPTLVANFFNLFLTIFTANLTHLTISILEISSIKLNTSFQISFDTFCVPLLDIYYIIDGVIF